MYPLPSLGYEVGAPSADLACQTNRRVAERRARDGGVDPECRAVGQVLDDRRAVGFDQGDWAEAGRGESEG
jgi:hypothetical protein